MVRGVRLEEGFRCGRTPCSGRNACAGHDKYPLAFAGLDIVGNCIEAALGQRVWRGVIAYDGVFLTHLVLAVSFLVGTVPSVSWAASAPYFEGFS